MISLYRFIKSPFLVQPEIEKDRLLPILVFIIGCYVRLYRYDLSFMMGVTPLWWSILIISHLQIFLSLLLLQKKKTEISVLITSIFTIIKFYGISNRIITRIISWTMSKTYDFIVWIDLHFVSICISFFICRE